MSTLRLALLASACTAFSPLAEAQFTTGFVWAPFVRAYPPTVDTYTINVSGWHGELTVELTDISGRGADLYLRKGAPPTLTQWDFRSALPQTSDESITVNEQDLPALSNGTWYAGIFRTATTAYDISWSFETRASTHAGMGATPYSEDGGGVAFRVWAPNADSVALAGDFNNWSSSSAPMVPDASGNWSVDVRELDAGARYRYVVRNGAQTLWKNDPRAKEVTNSVGDSIVVDPDDFDWGNVPYSTPAWNDMVIYELHVGTFNDHVGGSPANLYDAVTRIPYLQDLGVNVVELMPVCEFAGDFSWGYNPAHPWSVEQAYGGLTALKTFIKECHDAGIAVMLDVLHNHYGPSDMDLWRFDGWSQGPYGGIYFYNDNCNGPTPWGDTRPDFGRGEVRSYIRDNTMMWLEEVRFDGLRWDSTSNIRMGGCGDIPEGWSLMQWVNDEINSSQPWKINTAEDLFNAPNDWITKTTGEGGAGFDSQWDALFVHPMRAAVETPNDNDRDMWAVRNAITHYYNGSAFQRVIYSESHDEVANGRSRVPEEIWPGNAASWFSKKRSTLAGSLVFTSPGIPMMFMGQEFLEDGYFHDDDPLDWNKLTLYPGIHALYKDLIRLRRNLDGFSAGLKGNNTNVHHVNNGDKVIAFHRWDQGGVGDDVVVLSNFKNQGWSNYTIGLPRGGLWKVRFNSDWSGYDPTYGDWPSFDVNAVASPYDGMPYRASLSFGPYTTIILSQ